MKMALENEDNPLDANLEKVIPGLHQWHQANHSELKNVKVSLEQVAEMMREGFDGLEHVHTEKRAESDKHLAGVFLSIAVKLLQSSSGSNIQAESMDLDSLIGNEGLNQLPEVITNCLELVSPEGSELPELEDASSNNQPPSTSPVHTQAASMSSPSKFWMQLKHQTFSDLWNEWHGTGSYPNSEGRRHQRLKQEVWKGMAITPSKSTLFLHFAYCSSHQRFCQS
jgi:hypothetical protein